MKERNNKSSLVLTPETWIISDTHFGHQNILRLCSRPDDSFTLIERRWHELIGKDDLVLHLGDLAFRNTSEELQKQLKALPGHKFLLKGNHDRQRPEWYRDLGFELIESFLWHEPRVGKAIRFSHRADTYFFDWSTNIHGHCHCNGYSEALDRNRDYRNVSVEVMNYEPVRLEDVLWGEKYQGIRQAPVQHAR